MMYITLLALFGAALSSPLEDGLKSGEALMALFSEYTQAEGHHYTAAEAPMRLRIFRSELKAVVETNAADLGWTAGLNFMTDLTVEEKAQYLGLNSTVLPEDEGELMPLSSTPPPSSVDWRSSGAVTSVKNQGSCGSCWAFAAIGSIEGVHKIKSGSLVTFSDQELLDCTYEGRRDGCQGGWYHDAFSLLRRTQRLSSMSATPYRGRDGRCSYSRVNNSLRTRVSGHQRVSTSESGLASALSGGPVSVAFQVTNNSQRYRSGEFRDNSCRTTPNHAVTAVGYTSTAIIVKNSWGSGWGSRGYIHFKRGHHNCGLYTNNAIVSMSGRQQEQEE